MTTSSQLTKMIESDVDPRRAEFKIWKNTRYLVAQAPATPDFSDTRVGIYKGCFVIPGPKANPELSDKLGFPHLTIRDFEIMKQRYFIRFVDNLTTEDASEDIKRSLYTVMSQQDANNYESILRKQKDANKPKTVLSQTT